MDFNKLDHFKTFYFENHEEEQIIDALKFELFTIPDSNLYACRFQIRRHFFFFIEVLRIIKNICTSPDTEKQRLVFISHLKNRLTWLELLDVLKKDELNYKPIAKLFESHPLTELDYLNGIRSLSLIKNDYAILDISNKIVLFENYKDKEFSSDVNLCYENKNMMLMSEDSLGIMFSSTNPQYGTFGRAYKPVSEEQYLKPQAKFLVEEIFSNIPEY